MQFTTQIKELINRKVDYAKRVMGTNKGAAKAVLDEAETLEQVLTEMQRMSTEITLLKQRNTDLEAVALIHGITDYQMWLKRGSEYLLCQVKDCLSMHPAYVKKRKADVGGEKYCYTPELIRQHYKLTPKQETEG